MDAAHGDQSEDEIRSRYAEIARLHRTEGVEYRTARRLVFIRWLVTTSRLTEELQAADRHVAGTSAGQDQGVLAGNR
jgi:hypothetical protein